jgi:Holliday junction resolvasome RuvABC endonuclease subunit
MVQTVLGIDPSLTATGVAWVSRDGANVSTPLTATLHSTGRRDDPLSARAARIEGIVHDFCVLLGHIPGKFTMAVMEGPSHGSVGGSAWDRAGLWWRLDGVLRSVKAPVAICAPGTRIKWATGSGRATKSTKSDVAVALSRLWPDVDAKGDNEWDALSLGTIGAQHLGWDVPGRAHHPESVRKVAWP